MIGITRRGGLVVGAEVWPQDKISLLMSTQAGFFGNMCRGLHLSLSELDCSPKQIRGALVFPCAIFLQSARKERLAGSRI